MSKFPHNPTSSKNGLIEASIVELNDEQSRELLDALANPPAPNEALRRLLATPAPWADRRP